ncbi:WecB/TagA/CpsF family glycosyltransferase [Peptococcus simiae]|uniref:WecB/TagA/CpsF family glycosyltransferase n=1 Tax=Peptococcus simiae TaxID=1643805 RepID=A0ABW9H0A0_9FIRM
MELFGIRIDSVTRAEALDQIIRACQDQASLQVITANPEIALAAKEDPALRDLINSAGLVTPDGNGILLAARLLGDRLPERVTGIDLAEDLCRISGQKDLALYFLGGKPGVAQAAADRMARLYPGVRVVGSRHGYFRGHEEEVLADIKAAHPDILLVGLGAPAQESFIRRWQKDLAVPVAIGVGGSFDVMSGQIRRAPDLVQRLRLEWAWRIFSDWRRLPRLLNLVRFVGAVCREKVHRRR